MNEDTFNGSIRKFLKALGGERATRDREGRPPRLGGGQAQGQRNSLPRARLRSAASACRTRSKARSSWNETEVYLRGYKDATGAAAPP
jgi:hypothetical protein